MIFRIGIVPLSLVASIITLFLASSSRWVADRAANLIIVVDTRTDTVVNEINLAGAVSPHPAPDILDISPGGRRVYATLRGPLTLTGNNPSLNNAQGQTPSRGMMLVKPGGKDGTLKAVFPV